MRGRREGGREGGKEQFERERETERSGVASPHADMAAHGGITRCISTLMTTRTASSPFGKHEDINMSVHGQIQVQKLED